MKMQSLFLAILTPLLIFGLFFLLKSTAYAQSAAIDVTSVYTINDDQAKNGDILFYTSKGLVRANAALSNQIFGVLQSAPVLVYRTVDGKGKPVLRTGTAEVNVSNSNGDIKIGDYVTSSTIPGYGEKAAQSGYVVGIALANFQQESKINVGGQQVSVGKVPVALRIEYAEISNTRSFLRLLDAFNAGIFANIKDPDKASQFTRLLAAIIIVIISIILSFLIFTRSITKSIEAIGRNPMAKNAIQLSILINAALTVLTILLGLGAAYILIKV